MDKMSNKYVKSMNVFFLVLIIVSAVVYGAIVPQYYVGLYPVMLLFYYFLGFAAVNIYGRALERTPSRATNVFLLVRMMKMLLTVIFAVVYCFVGKQVIAFIIPFASLYLLFLLFDTCFYYRYETATKQKIVNNESK